MKRQSLLLVITILTLSFFALLIGCGGGSSTSSGTVPIVVTATPVIEPTSIPTPYKTGNISGRVYTSTGAEFAGAFVEFQSFVVDQKSDSIETSALHYTQTTVAGTDGTYSFTGVPQGACRISFWASQYDYQNNTHPLGAVNATVTNNSEGIIIQQGQAAPTPTNTPQYGITATPTKTPLPGSTPTRTSPPGSTPTFTPKPTNTPTPTSNSSYIFVRKWGSNGSGDGQFDGLEGIAIDSLGNVYVTDTNNNRIQKFTSSGNFITKWGSFGEGNGQFNGILGIEVDSSNSVYVSGYNSIIQKFNSSGAFITKYEIPSTNSSALFDVAIDSYSNIYFTTGIKGKIWKITSSGTFITKWGEIGGNDGQFNICNGIALDTNGNVYVADHGNKRIQKFTSSGNFITKWGTNNTPNGIAIDSYGNIYVAEEDCIEKFTLSGNFITKWGSYGSGDGQFIIASGIALDSSGNVYVTDMNPYNYRVQVFAPR